MILINANDYLGSDTLKLQNAIKDWMSEPGQTLLIPSCRSRTSCPYWNIEDFIQFGDLKDQYTGSIIFDNVFDVVHSDYPIVFTNIKNSEIKNLQIRGKGSIHFDGQSCGGNLVQNCAIEGGGNFQIGSAVSNDICNFKFYNCRVYNPLNTGFSIDGGNTLGLSFDTCSVVDANIAFGQYSGGSGSLFINSGATRCKQVFKLNWGMDTRIVYGRSEDCENFIYMGEQSGTRGGNLIVDGYIIDNFTGTILEVRCAATINMYGVSGQVKLGPSPTIKSKVILDSGSLTGFYNQKGNSHPWITNGRLKTNGNWVTL